ncbi:MAG: hypothetical protein MJA29_02585, partial [Candidatus Omnitrophica bacterium]|nr:hypothetical protein [Candidatus Omnitrophota bacterium]
YPLPLKNLNPPLGGGKVVGGAACLIWSPGPRQICFIGYVPVTRRIKLYTLFYESLYTDDIYDVTKTGPCLK